MSIAEMQTKLKGKAAIVTGASAGVGWQTAKTLAQEGVKVIATARRGQRLEQLTIEIRAQGGEAAYCAGDDGSFRGSRCHCLRLYAGFAYADPTDDPPSPGCATELRS